MSDTTSVLHHTPGSAPRTATPSILDKLRNRSLVLTGDNEMLAAAAAATNAPTRGLVVTGTASRRSVARLRHAHPHAILLAEPTSLETHTATEGAPFATLVEDHALFGPSIEEIIHGQLHAGADAAILPSGHVLAGDSDALKAIIAGVPDAERHRILLVLSLDPAWLLDLHFKQLTAILRSAPVAVAVAFASKTNPLHTEAMLRRYGALFRAVPDLIAWRIDQAGLFARANGAAAAVFGLIPSHRRATPPSSKGFARNPRDKTPQLLVPELLSVVHSSRMHTEWYASSEPRKCACPPCDGRAIDSFSGSTEDRYAGHLHNLHGFAELGEAASASADLPSWWRRTVLDASAAYVSLGATAQRTIAKPGDLRAFEKFALESN